MRAPVERFAIRTPDSESEVVAARLREGGPALWPVLLFTLAGAVIGYMLPALL